MAEEYCASASYIACEILAVSKDLLRDASLAYQTKEVEVPFHQSNRNRIEPLGPTAQLRVWMGVEARRVLHSSVMPLDIHNLRNGSSIGNPSTLDRPR